jgi:serine/threonine-protein kinase
MASDKTRFLVRGTLGSGAFGVVKRAFDSLFEQEVAIKIPHDSAMEKGLVTEMITMDRIRALNEPHLVQLREPARIERKLAIVMEYVDGGSLRTRLGEIGAQRAMPPRAATDLMLQVCQALRVTHRKLNLVHRDIKPDNILIRKEDNLVKVGDFGIARILATAQRTSSVAGTVPYMAPEVLECDGYDLQVDVYSVGVVFYEALTGRLPYNPLTDSGSVKPHAPYIAEICAGQAVAPHALPGSMVERELSEIVMRAMARRPAQRYPSIDALEDDLKRLRGGPTQQDRLAEALLQKDPAVRLRMLSEITEKWPRNPKHHLALGRHFSDLMRFEEARAVFLRGTELVPESGPLWMQLAFVHARLERLPEAIASMERALAVGLPPKDLAIGRGMIDIWRRRAGAK